MEKIIFQLRKFLWRILGVDYERFLRRIDYTFLRDDPFTSMGFKSYENGATVIRSGEAKIEIGKYCSIAQFTTFIVDGGNHNYSDVISFPLFDSLFSNDELDKTKFKSSFQQKEGIFIGNDVWVGSGSYILPGVKIGNGAIVAANSVVTKDVPDYALVAGVPAKIVKMRHDESTLTKLNVIAWWDWEEQVIKDRMNDFYYTETDVFINKYYHQ